MTVKPNGSNTQLVRMHVRNTKRYTVLENIHLQKNGNLITENQYLIYQVKIT